MALIIQFYLLFFIMQNIDKIDLKIYFYYFRFIFRSFFYNNLMALFMGRPIKNFWNFRIYE